MTTDEIKPEKNYVKGFAITSAEVKKSESKGFVIVQEPTYKKWEDPKTKEEKDSMLLGIDFNGIIVDYYPNKTSQTVIMANVENGRELANWVGFTGTFKVVRIAR